MTKNQHDLRTLGLFLVMGAGLVVVKLLFPEATQNIAR